MALMEVGWGGCEKHHQLCEGGQLACFKFPRETVGQPLRSQGERMWLLQWMSWGLNIFRSKRGILLSDGRAWPASGHFLQGAPLLDVRRARVQVSKNHRGLGSQLGEILVTTNMGCRPGWGRGLPATWEGHGTDA